MLIVDGEVARPLQLSRVELAALDAQHQVPDVQQWGAKRPGRAVRLAAVLDLAGVKPSAQYLTLHATRDNFHASVPLAAVRQRGLVIYEVHGADLPEAAGGPFRFFIPDFAACHSAEVDECANVKFVDRMELSAGKGFDNRPLDEQSHAALHQHEQAQQQQQ